MREKEGEKHQRVVASHTPSTGVLASNPGMCPDWELNQQPFGTQFTEPHKPGLIIVSYNCFLNQIGGIKELETKNIFYFNIYSLY